MKKLIILLALLLVSCVKTPQPEPEVVPGKWKIKLTQASRTDKNVQERLQGLKLRKAPFGWVVVESDENPAEFLNKSEYLAIEPVYVVRLIQPQVGAEAKDYWNLHRVQAPEARQISTGQDKTVYVVDTGINVNLREFPDYSLFRCRSFVPSEDCSINHPHASHVASTCCGTDNGVSRASVWSAKVLDTEGSGEDIWVAEGMRWATDNRADIINLSLGTGFESQILCDAVTHAVDAGVLVVAATGNNRDDKPSWPAACQNAIAVGATNDANQKAWFSNRFGPKLWGVSAPGEHICAWAGQNGTECWSGTSMATPHVAAVGAMARQLSPTLNQASFAGLLEETVEDLGEPGRDATYGYGLLNALRALGGGGVPTLTAAPPVPTVTTPYPGPTKEVTPTPVRTFPPATVTPDATVEPTVTVTPLITVSPTNPPTGCSITVQRLARSDEMDRWHVASGLGFLNLVGGDGEKMSANIIEDGEWVGLVIKADREYVCVQWADAFRTLGYKVR